MPPSDYVRTRELSSQEQQQQPSATTATGQYFSQVVDKHPYFPNLSVDVSNLASVKHAALVLVYSSILLNNCGEIDKDKLYEFFDSNNTRNEIPAAMGQLTCTKVTGGITNALFRVSGFQSIKPLLLQDSAATASSLEFDSVLVRIFGAEGMIDRDIETSTYAALCNADIAYKYMGRFSNGRIEGWLDGYHPLSRHDLYDTAYFKFLRGNFVIIIVVLVVVLLGVRN
jgi:ethanolamine kinase